VFISVQKAMAPYYKEHVGGEWSEGYIFKAAI
jgi:hypothetical protein